MDAEPEDAAVQNTFNSIDTDHNGQIDPIELSKYLDRFRHALKPFLGVSDYNAPIYPPPNRNYKSRHGENAFWAGFASGILSIWATEVGDKTFFIAAVLSMRNDRIIVFAGAIGALIIMTIISVVMGGVAAHFLPSEITHYIGAFMFIFFGVKMLYDSRNMSRTGPSNELIEVEEELAVNIEEERSSKEQDDAHRDMTRLENGDCVADKNELNRHALAPASSTDMIQIFTQAFLLTFLAEWGDRSQIATITLSATNDAFGVTLGAILGHSVCTGIAVVGGKLLASRITERTVTIIGGVLFLLFALHSFLVGPSRK